MAPVFKQIEDLGLSPAESAEAVARTTGSIFFEDPEPAVVGESTIFDISVPGDAYLERVVGVTFPPPRRFYASLQDVFYHPYSNIVTHNDEVAIEDTIAEMSRSFDEWPLNHLQLARVSTPAARASLPVCSEPTILGGHSSCCIFGHFLLDVLPLLVRFRKELNEGKVKVGFFHMKDWMTDFLRLIDVDLSSVKMLDVQPTRFDHAIISHHHSAKTTQYPCANAEVSYGYLRERTEDAGLFDRVFFLRGDAEKRLGNEMEVAAVFAEKGFVILDPQKFSIATQAQIVKRAKVLASVFGSGFSLCPLMAHGQAIVIELTPNTINDQWLRRLLARFKLKHYSVVYDGAAKAIDVGVLKGILDKILP